jgi:hypothetical protein
MIICLNEILDLSFLKNLSSIQYIYIYIYIYMRFVSLTIFLSTCKLCMSYRNQARPDIKWGLVRDRGGVPDLSVSRDNFDLVGDDPHDPTTTSETRSANAIAEPTPDGYRPCRRKISLITKINSCAQSKNEQESEASNLNITRKWSSESQRTVCICACSGVAKARCKTKLKSEN